MPRAKVLGNEEPTVLATMQLPSSLVASLCKYRGGKYRGGGGGALEIWSHVVTSGIQTVDTHAVVPDKESRSCFLDNVTTIMLGLLVLHQPIEYLCTAWLIW